MRRGDFSTGGRPESFQRSRRVWVDREVESEREMCGSVRSEVSELKAIASASGPFGFFSGARKRPVLRYVSWLSLGS